MAVQEVAAETMAACKDPLVKKQLAYLLGRQGVVGPPSTDGVAVILVNDEATAWTLCAVTEVPAATLTSFLLCFYFFKSAL